MYRCQENAAARTIHKSRVSSQNEIFTVHFPYTIIPSEASNCTSGDICQALKKYDEAFQYWDKAGELGTDFYDEYYCKASGYAELGDYEKAYHIYMELADKLRRDNYDVEAEMAEDEAKEIMLKMKS